MNLSTPRLFGWFRGLPQAAADALPVRLGINNMARTPATPVRVLGFDQALLWVCVALLAWGLVMVYSASIAMPDNPRFKGSSPTGFLLRHAVSIAVAFVAALLAFQVPMAVWEKHARLLFLVSLALALGLASMASSTLKIESLFIDEGFGSLDPESLQLAMDALDGLQAQGRKVAVISHVQEMHERIPVQIQVRRQGNGLSTLEVK